MEKTIVNIAPAAAETPRTKRVAAYARVSCGKDTMLHSLAAQIDYYRDYIISKPCVNSKASVLMFSLKNRTFTP